MKGKLKNIKDRDDVKGLCFEARTKHSEKPHEIRRRIETMCKDLPKIELFARKNLMVGTLGVTKYEKPIQNRRPCID